MKLTDKISHLQPGFNSPWGHHKRMLGWNLQIRFHPCNGSSNLPGITITLDTNSSDKIPASFFINGEVTTQDYDLGAENETRHNANTKAKALTSGHITGLERPLAEGQMKVVESTSSKTHTILKTI